MFQKSLFALSLVAMSLSSCQKGVPEAQLETAGDSILYALGVAQSADKATLSEFLTRVGADEKAVDKMIEGIATGVEDGYEAIEKVKDTDDKSEKAYYAGIMQGVEYASMLDRLNAQLLDSADVKARRSNFVAGFADYVQKQVKMRYKGAPLNLETASKAVEEIGMRLEEPRLLKQFGHIKKQGESYLAEKRKVAGVQTLPSGVMYRVLTSGTGAKPKATDRVAVRYVGKLTDGTIFDATTEHGTPADTFGVSQVIPGWTEALQQMPVGSKWEVYIPYRQAYGTRQTGKILPFSALTFEVELLGVVK